MTASATAIANLKLSTRGVTSGWSRQLLALGAAIMVVLLLAGAYAVGASRDRNAVHAVSGKAYAGKYQISANDASGWTYDVPLNVLWIDDHGVVIDGSRPACLRPDDERVPI